MNKKLVRVLGLLHVIYREDVLTFNTDIVPGVQPTDGGMIVWELAVDNIVENKKKINFQSKGLN